MSTDSVSSQFDLGHVSPLYYQANTDYSVGDVILGYRGGNPDPYIITNNWTGTADATFEEAYNAGLSANV